jgi:hypothetical protein
MVISSPIPAKDQAQWAKIFSESGYSIEWLHKETGINVPSLNKYIYNSRKPRKLNRIKMEKAMSKMSKGEKKLQRHPSFGYATAEQVELLNSLGLGPQRDFILSQIEKQNKSGGKIVFDVPENLKKKTKKENGDLI